MNRFAFPLLALATSALVQPALAAPVNARADYVLTVGGINVALIDVNLDDDGARYGIDVSAKVTGLGSVVASGTAVASAKGISTGSALEAQAFKLETRANGEVFNVDVSYAGKSVSSFKVEPPVESYDRIPLERGQLNGVVDFMSAFVLKGNALDRSLCDRTLNIFTGVERFDIRLGFLDNDEATSPRTGYQGPVVACSVKYKPISGHFSSSEMTNYMADQSRMVIWYAPLAATGYYIPYRVIIGTTMGDLSIVLTKLSS